MSESFQENIQEWVSLDNQIKRLNDKVRELRNERTNKEGIILQYVESEQLSNATINISDGKLRFSASKQTQPLTFKHVENCLLKCINNKEQVDKIITYIKDTREIKYINDIKRSYN